jgi:hypothetical protein
MQGFARAALVSLVVAAGLSLAGCALIEIELKDSVSKLTSQDRHEGDVPDVTGGILPTKTPGEEANNASEKRPPARTLQEPHTVNLPNKRSVPAEPVTQEPIAQSPPSQSAPSQLPTLWPEAPSPGRFSR